MGRAFGSVELLEVQHADGRRCDVNGIPFATATRFDSYVLGKVLGYYVDLVVGLVQIKG